MPYFTFKGIGGGSDNFFASLFILIELVSLISELFTDRKNSKYFSSYRDERKRNSLIMGPIFTPKMAIFGVLLCNKTWNLWLFILKVTKQLQGMLTQQNKVVWSIFMAVYP